MRKYLPGEIFDDYTWTKETENSYSGCKEQMLDDVVTKHIVKVPLNVKNKDLETSTKEVQFRQHKNDGTHLSKCIKKTMLRPKGFPTYQETRQEILAKEFQLTALPSHFIDESAGEKREIKANGDLTLTRIFKKSPGAKKSEADIIEEIVETVAEVNDENVEDLVIEAMEERLDKIKLDDGMRGSKLIKKIFIKPKTIKGQRDASEIGKHDTNVQEKPEELLLLQKFLSGVLPYVDLKQFHVVPGQPIVLRKKVVSSGDLSESWDEIIELAPGVENVNQDNVEIIIRTREFKECLPDGKVVTRILKKTVVTSKELTNHKETPQENVAREFQFLNLPSFELDKIKGEIKETNNGALVVTRYFKKSPVAERGEVDVVEEVIEIAPGTDEINMNDVVVESFEARLDDVQLYDGRRGSKVIKKTVITPKIIFAKRGPPGKSDRTSQERPEEHLLLLKNYISGILPNDDLEQFQMEVKPGQPVILRKITSPRKPSKLIEEIIELAPGIDKLNQDNVEITTKIREFKEHLPDGRVMIRILRKTVVTPKEEIVGKRKPHEILAKEFQMINLPSFELDKKKGEAKKTNKNGAMELTRYFKKDPTTEKGEADVVEEVIEIADGTDEINMNDVVVDSFQARLEDVKLYDGRQGSQIVKKTIITPRAITAKISKFQIKEKESVVSEEVEELLRPKSYISQILPNLDLTLFKTTSAKPGQPVILRKKTTTPEKPSESLEETIELAPGVDQMQQDNVEISTSTREFKEYLPDGQYVTRILKKTIVKPKGLPAPKEPRQEILFKEFQLPELPSFRLDERRGESKVKNLDGSFVVTRIFKKSKGAQKDEADVVEEVIETASGIDETNVDDVVVETFETRVDNVILDDGRKGSKVIRRTVVRPKAVGVPEPAEKFVEPHVVIEEVEKKFDAKVRPETKVQDRPQDQLVAVEKVIAGSLPSVDLTQFQTTVSKPGQPVILRKKTTTPEKPSESLEETIELAPGVDQMQQDNVEISTSTREFKEYLPDGQYVTRILKKTIVKPKGLPAPKEPRQEILFKEFQIPELPSFRLDERRGESKVKNLDGSFVVTRIFKKSKGAQKDEADVVEEVIETASGIDETNVDDVVVETFETRVDNVILDDGRKGSKVIRRTVVRPKAVGVPEPAEKFVEPHVVIEEVEKKFDAKVRPETKVQDRPQDQLVAVEKVIAGSLPSVDLTQFQTTVSKPGQPVILRKKTTTPEKPSESLEETIELAPGVDQMQQDNVEISTSTREFKEYLPDGQYVTRILKKTIVKPKGLPAPKEPRQEILFKEFQIPELPSFRLDERRGESKVKNLDGSFVVTRIFKKSKGAQKDEADVVEEVIETASGIDETNVDDVVVETFETRVDNVILDDGRKGSKVIRRTVVRPKAVGVPEPAEKFVEPHVVIEEVEKKFDAKVRPETKVQDRPQDQLVAVEKVIAGSLPSVDLTQFQTTVSKPGQPVILRKKTTTPEKPSESLEETIELAPGVDQMQQDNVEISTSTREFKEYLPDGQYVTRILKKTIVKPKGLPAPKEPRQEILFKEFQIPELPSFRLDERRGESKVKNLDGSFVVTRIFKKSKGAQKDEADVVEEVIETASGIDETNVDDVVVETFETRVDNVILDDGRKGSKVIRRTVVRPKAVGVPEPAEKFVEPHVVIEEVEKKFDAKVRPETKVQDRPQDQLVAVEKVIAGSLPSVDLTQFQTTVSKPGQPVILRKKTTTPEKPSESLEETIELAPGVDQMQQDNVEISTSTREFKEYLPDGQYVTRILKKTIVKPKGLPAPKEPRQEILFKEFQIPELPSFRLDERRGESKVKNLDGSFVVTRIFKKSKGAQKDEADVVEEVIETASGIDETNVDDVVVETFETRVDNVILDDGRKGSKVIRRTVVRPKAVGVPEPAEKFVEPHVVIEEVEKKFDAKVRPETKVQDRPQDQLVAVEKVIAGSLPSVDLTQFQTTVSKPGQPVILRKKTTTPEKPSESLEETIELAPGVDQMQQDNVEISTSTREFKEYLPDGQYVTRILKKTIVKPKGLPAPKEPRQEILFKEFQIPELPSFRLDERRGESKVKNLDGSFVVTRIFKKSKGAQKDEADVVEEVIETASGIDETNVDDVVVETFETRVDNVILDDGRKGSKVIRRTVVRPKAVGVPEPAEKFVEPHVVIEEVEKKFDAKVRPETKVQDRPQDQLVAVEKVIAGSLPSVDLTQFQTTVSKPGQPVILRKKTTTPEKPSESLEETIELAPGVDQMQQDNVEISTSTREFKEYLPDGQYVTRILKKTIVKPKGLPAPKEPRQEILFKEFQIPELPSFRLDERRGESKVKNLDGSFVVTRIFKKSKGAQKDEADVVEEVIETASGIDETNVDDVVVETFETRVDNVILDDGRKGSKVIRRTVVRPKAVGVPEPAEKFVEPHVVIEEVEKKFDAKVRPETKVQDRPQDQLVAVEKVIAGSLPSVDLTQFQTTVSKPGQPVILRKKTTTPEKPSESLEETIELAPGVDQMQQDNVEISTSTREFKEYLPDGQYVTRILKKTIVKPKGLPAPKEPRQEILFKEFQIPELPSFRLDERRGESKVKNLDGSFVVTRIFKKSKGAQKDEADVVEEVIETASGIDETNVDDVVVETFETRVDNVILDDGRKGSKVIRRTVVRPKAVGVPEPAEKFVEPHVVIEEVEKKFDAKVRPETKVQDRPQDQLVAVEKVIAGSLPSVDLTQFQTTVSKPGQPVILRKKTTTPEKPSESLEETIELAPGVDQMQQDNVEISTSTREFKEYLPDGQYVTRILKKTIVKPKGLPAPKEPRQEILFKEFQIPELPSFRLDERRGESKVKNLDGSFVVTRIFKKSKGAQKDEADVVEEVIETASGIDETNVDDVVVETFETRVDNVILDDGRKGSKVIRRTVVRPKAVGVPEPAEKFVEPHVVIEEVEKKFDAKVRPETKVQDRPQDQLVAVEKVIAGSLPSVDLTQFQTTVSKPGQPVILRKKTTTPEKPSESLEETIELAPGVDQMQQDNVEISTSTREFKEYLPDGQYVTRILKKTIVKPKGLPAPKEPRQEILFKEFQIPELPSFRLDERRGESKVKNLDGSFVVTRIFKKSKGAQKDEADVVEEVIETASGIDETNVDDVVVETFETRVDNVILDDGRKGSKVIRRTVVRPKAVVVPQPAEKFVEPQVVEVEKKFDAKVRPETKVQDRPQDQLVAVEKVIAGSLPSVDLTQFQTTVSKPGQPVILRKKTTTPEKPSESLEETIELAPGVDQMQQDNVEISTSTREFKEYLSDGQYVTRILKKTIVKPKGLPAPKEPRQEILFKEFQIPELPSFRLDERRGESKVKNLDGSFVVTRIFKKSKGAQKDEADVVEEVIETASGIDETNVDDVVVETFETRVDNVILDDGRKGSKVIRRTVVRPKAVGVPEPAEKFVEPHVVIEEVEKKFDAKVRPETKVQDRPQDQLVAVEKVIAGSLPSVDLTQFQTTVSKPGQPVILRKKTTTPEKPSESLEETIELAPGVDQMQQDNVEISTSTREFKEYLPDGQYVTRILKKTIVKPKGLPAPKEPRQEILFKEFQIPELPSFRLDERRGESKVKNLDGSFVVTRIFKKSKGAQKDEADVVEEVIETASGIDETNVDDVVVETFETRVDNVILDDGRKGSKVIRRTVVRPKAVGVPEPAEKFVEPHVVIEEVEKKFDAKVRPETKVQDRPQDQLVAVEKVIAGSLPSVDLTQFQTTVSKPGQPVILRKKTTTPEKPSESLEETIELAPGVDQMQQDNVEISTSTREFKEYLPDGQYVTRILKKTIVKPKGLPAPKEPRQEILFKEFQIPELPSFRLDERRGESKVKNLDGSFVVTRIFKKSKGAQKDEADVVEEVIETASGIDETNVDDVVVETFETRVDNVILDDGRKGSKVIRRTVVRPKAVGVPEPAEKFVEPHVVIEEVEKKFDAKVRPETKVQDRPQDQLVAVEKVIAGSLPSVDLTQFQTTVSKPGQPVILRKKTTTPEKPSESLEETIELAPGVDQMQQDNVEISTSTREFKEYLPDGQYVTRILKKTIVKPKGLPAPKEPRQEILFKEFQIPELPSFRLDERRGESKVKNLDGSFVVTRIFKKSKGAQKDEADVVEEVIETASGIDETNVDDVVVETFETRVDNVILDDGRKGSKVIRRTVVRPKAVGVPEPAEKFVEPQVVEVEKKFDAKVRPETKVQDRPQDQLVAVEKVIAGSLPSVDLTQFQTTVSKPGQPVILRKKTTTPEKPSESLEETIELAPGVDQMQQDNVEISTSTREFKEYLPDGQYVTRILKKTIVKPKGLPAPKEPRQEILFKEFQIPELPSFRLDERRGESKVKNLDGSFVVTRIFKKSKGAQKDEADVVEEVIETASGIDETNVDDVVVETFETRVDNVILDDGRKGSKVIRRTVVRPKAVGIPEPAEKFVEPHVVIEEVEKKFDAKVRPETKVQDRPQDQLVAVEKVIAGSLPSVDLTQFQTTVSKPGQPVILRKKTTTPEKPSESLEETIELAPGVDQMQQDNVEISTSTREFKEYLPDGQYVTRILKKTIVKPKGLPAPKEPRQEILFKEFQIPELPSFRLDERRGESKVKNLDGSFVVTRIFKKSKGAQKDEADVVEEVIETASGIDETNVDDVVVETFETRVDNVILDDGRKGSKVIRRTVVRPKAVGVPEPAEKFVEPHVVIEEVEKKFDAKVRPETKVQDRPQDQLVAVEKVIAGSLPSVDLTQFQTTVSKPGQPVILRKKTTTPEKPSESLEETIELAPGVDQMQQDNVEISTSTREFKEYLSDGQYVTRILKKTIVKPKGLPAPKEPRQEILFKEFQIPELPSFRLDERRGESKVKNLDGSFVVTRIFKKSKGAQKDEADVVEEVIETASGIDETNVDDVVVETFETRVDNVILDDGRKGSKVIRRTVVRPKAVGVPEPAEKFVEPQVVEVEKKFDAKVRPETKVQDRPQDQLVAVEKVIAGSLPSVDLTQFQTTVSKPGQPVILRKKTTTPEKPSESLEETIELAPGVDQMQQDNVEISTSTREFKEYLPDGQYVTRILKKTIVKPKGLPAPKEPRQEILFKEFQIPELPSFRLDERRGESKVKNLDGSFVVTRIFKKSKGAQKDEADVVEEVIETASGIDETNVDDVVVETFETRVDNVILDDGRKGSKVIRRTVVRPKAVGIPEPAEKFVEPHVVIEEVEKKFDAKVRPETKVQDRPQDQLVAVEKVIAGSLPSVDLTQFQTTVSKPGQPVILRKKTTTPEKPSESLEETIELAPGVDQMQQDNVEISTSTREFKEYLPDGQYVTRILKKTIVKPKGLPAPKEPRQEILFKEFQIPELPSFRLDERRGESKVKNLDGSFVVTRIFKKSKGAQKDEADVVEEVIETASGIDETNVDDVVVETFETRVDNVILDDGRKGSKVIRRTVVRPKAVVVPEPAKKFVEPQVVEVEKKFDAKVRPETNVQDRFDESSFLPQTPRSREVIVMTHEHLNIDGNVLLAPRAKDFPNIESFLEALSSDSSGFSFPAESSRTDTPYVHLVPS